MRFLIVLAILQSCAAVAYAQPAMNLVWSDEFDGGRGTRPDATKWTYDLGAGGWGNHELETYTDSAENASIDGDGHLVIRAIQTGTRSYTPARMKTKARFEFQYGRVEARMRIPFGQGIWPAFWMLGADIDKVGWPQCGEIDIMENIGKEPGTVHGTVHGPGYSGGSGRGAPFNLRPGRFADDFHLYSVEWGPASMDFFVDGQRYFVVVPGNPDASTTLPQEMVVDWVRVYANAAEAPHRRRI